MKLVRFEATGLNGYLSFDLDISRSLNFLIGINGSGKTTVLRAIMSLLGPDIGWLNTTAFERLSLTFEHQTVENHISAERTEAGTTLFSSIGGLEHRVLLNPEVISKLSRHEEEYAYDDDGTMLVVRETQISTPDTIEVFRAIKALPNPIFLGLDRSSLPSPERRNKARTRANAARRGHATLRTFLDESVAQAENIAVAAGRAAVVERSRRAVILREKVLLSLFSDLDQDFGLGRLPTKQDIRNYESTRKSLKQAFTILGISTDNIGSNIDPFFTTVISTASQLTKFKSGREITESSDRDVFFRWLDMSPRLALISRVESLVKEFNSDERTIFERIRRYEEILNSFLVDSKKHLTFKEDGDLKIAVPSSSSGDVFFLSSGERQLFVLITTLMFNQDETSADVLIIDEPELSLHIQWQSMFVDALQQANPDIQIILATHSPSIINDRDDCCVDLA